MSNNIDALIANFPETLQRNSLAQQQTQLAGQNSIQNMMKLIQQGETRNALRDIYSNPQNIDPSTGLPNPRALSPLFRVNPPVGLDFSETLGKLNDAQARAALTNLRTNEYFTNIYDEKVVGPLVNYGRQLQTQNLPPDQYQQMIATKKDELEQNTIKGYGIPDSIAQRWGNLTPNLPVWAAQSSLIQARNDKAAKSWVDKTYVDPATGETKSYSINPEFYPGIYFHPDRYTPMPEGFQPSDVKSVAKPGAGKMMYVQNPDGTTTPELVLQRGGNFTNQKGEPVTVIGEVPSSSPDYAGPAAKPSGDPNLTGDAYLTQLPKDRQPLVKALSEGRIAVPTWALRDPTWKQIIADTAQYDPSFDATNFNRRNKAYQEFTSGQDGRNVRSINTALNHAAELWHSTDNLASHEWWKGEGGPWVNWANQKLKQSIDPQLKGAINRFKVNADALSSELERATRGDRTAERGVEEWRNNFSQVDTPEAMKESIKEAWKLLAGRVDSLQEGFKKAVGPRAEVTDLFTPFAKDTYRAFEEGKSPPDISGLVSGATGGRTGASAPAAPASSSPSWPVSSFPANIRSLPDGMKFNNGQYIKRGDKIYFVGGQ